MQRHLYVQQHVGKHINMAPAHRLGSLKSRSPNDLDTAKPLSGRSCRGSLMMRQQR